MHKIHVVYDNCFQIVSSSEDTIPKFWVKLVESERENFLLDLYDELRLEEDKNFKEL